MNAARFVDAIRLDLRVAARRLAAAPGFTVIAVALLALSIGATTTIYSALRAALVRAPAAVTADRQLVWLTTFSPLEGRSFGISLADVARLEQLQPGVLTSVGAYDVSPLALGTADEPARVSAHLVVGDYFGTLGVRPAQGRFFHHEELNVAAGRPVIVLSHHLWVSRFAAAPVEGMVVRVNGDPFTVVGVAPPRFAGPEVGDAAEAWIPVGAAATVLPERARELGNPEHPALRVVARLAPALAPQAAAAALDALLQAARDERGVTASDGALAPVVRIDRVAGGIPPAMRREAGPIGILFMSAAVITLCIVGMNVATLLLGRALTRERDIATCRALGASRVRLVSQALAESILLSLLGSGAGVLLAIGLTRFIGSRPALLALRVEPDLPVVLFALALAILTAMVAGAAPALRVSRASVATSLSQRGRSVSTGPGRARTHFVLIAGQLAASLVLVHAATQFVLSIHAAMRVDLGMQTRGVTAASFDLVLQRYDDTRREAFTSALLADARSTLDVQEAALASVVPLSGIAVGASISLGDENHHALLNSVSPGYFDVLAIRPLEGRVIEPADGRGAAPVAVMNATAARRLAPRASAVGKQIKVEGVADVVTIVGVVADSKYDEPTEPTPPFVYLSYAQSPVLPQTTLLVRARGDLPVRPERLRSLIQSKDSGLPVFEAFTLDNIARERLDRQTAISRLLLGFGASGLLVASIGLYGVAALVVTQRRKELAICTALGATPSAIMRTVLARAARMTLAGVVAGAVLAIPASLALSYGVFGIEPLPVLAFTAAAAVLVLAALLATWLPARRALRIAPAAALASE